MPFYTVYDATIAGLVGNDIGRHLVRASTGRLWCVFAAVVAGYAEMQLFCAYSDDDGATWTSEQITAVDIYQYVVTLAIDSQDNLHIVYQGSGRAPLPARFGIFYRKRTAGVWGAEETVALLDVAGIAQDAPTIALDSANDVHIAWHGKGWGVHPTYNQIIYRKRTGGVWGAIEEVTSKNINIGFGEIYPAIAIDRNDNVHLVWESTHNPFNYTMSRYRERTSVGWQAEEVININNDGYAVHPRIALDSNNDVHAVWTDMLASEGWVAYNPKYRKRTAGVWGATENIATIARDQYDTLSISIELGDNIHVVWSGLGWGVNINWENLQYRERTAGGWDPQVALTDAPINHEGGSLIWANWPLVNGVRTNIPNTGFAIVYQPDVPNAIMLYTAVTWPAPPTPVRINKAYALAREEL